MTRICTVLLATLLLCAAAQARPPLPELSPRLSEAARALAINPGAARAVFAELARHGLPLVEPDPEDAAFARVSFVYAAGPNASAVWLDSAVNAPWAAAMVSDYERDFLIPLYPLGGGLWGVTLRLPRETRAAYAFVTAREDAMPERRADSAAHSRLRGADGESVFALDRAPSQPWNAALPPERRETAQRLVIASAALGREVAVDVWTPEGDAPAHALILFGAFQWGVRAPAWETARRLTEAGLAPPLLVALIDELDDASALAAYADTGAFIAGELLPALRARWLLTEGAEAVTVAGASRRGLAAVIAAIERPDAVGAAISLSGSFYWAPQGEGFEWLARRVAALPAPGPARIHLAAGSMETVVTSTNHGHVMVETNRRLAHALSERGWRVSHAEFSGGHDLSQWRGALAEGLIAIYSAD